MLSPTIGLKLFPGWINSLTADLTVLYWPHAQGEHHAELA
jgi:hypothetical protein